MNFFACFRYANVKTPERHVRTRLYFTSVSLTVTFIASVFVYVIFYFGIVNLNVPFSGLVLYA